MTVLAIHDLRVTAYMQFRNPQSEFRNLLASISSRLARGTKRSLSTRNRHYTKRDVVVASVRGIPVAIRRTYVVSIVVPRTTAQHPEWRNPPFDDSNETDEICTANFSLLPFA